MTVVIVMPSKWLILVAGFAAVSKETQVTTFDNGLVVVYKQYIMDEH